MTNELSGKTCLVTGSSSGIGLETAVSLAAMGATVCLVARDEGRGAQAVEEVRRRSGSAKVELFFCDFASQRSIRRLAADFRARHDRLHVLVNNAGGAFPERAVTEDGIERTFAVNHLGYFLLTVLLLDVLEASAPARVVNVSSRGHRNGTLDFDDLGFEKGGYGPSFMGGLPAYGRSKLANLLFTAELARRQQGRGVTANALHPGVVGTRIWNSQKGLPGLLLRFVRPFFLSPAQGARTIVFLASSPAVEAITGQYFVDCKPVRPSRLAEDAALGARLWAESERLVAPSAG